MELRPYQKAAHVAIRECWAEGNPGAMLVLCTGGGKTFTALSLVVSDFLKRGKRVIWLAGRRELLDQPAMATRKTWPEESRKIGIVQAGRDRPDAQFVFASIQTIQNERRMAAILAHGYPDLVVYDECHHAPSPTSVAAMERLCERGALRLGLTATPTRDDGADLSEDWEIAYSYGITDAIRDGYLVPPYAAVERLPDLDLSRVSGRRDYDDGELAAELLRAGIVEHTVEQMARAHTARRLPLRDDRRTLEARGRSTLVFVPTVALAATIAEALREAGWKARHVSGKTPDADRRRLLGAFRNGRIEVLVNVGVLTEGTDLPIASCIVLARPTRSWSLFTQIVGRGLRLFAGKSEALILDLAGATEDHSLISAPVLIGGKRCPKSPNGSHDMIPAENPQEGAKCSHCGAKVACGVSLAGHTWGDDHKCTGCGRPQCVESEDGAHTWIPQADHKRKCMDCGAEVPDPLAGLANRKPRGETLDADWIRVPGLTPETYVVDLEPHGLLFVVGDRRTATWTPIWLVKGGRRPRPLVSEPLPREYVRGYADDLVRRAAQVAEKGASWKQNKPRRYDIVKAEAHGVHWKGENAGELARRLLKVRARERAIKTGISHAAK